MEPALRDSRPVTTKDVNVTTRATLVAQMATAEEIARQSGIQVARWMLHFCAHKESASSTSTSVQVDTTVISQLHSYAPT